MEDFKKLDEYNNNSDKKSKKPEENMRQHSQSLNYKTPPIFSSNKPILEKNHNPQISQTSELNFYQTLLESQRVSCLNREALRNNIKLETEREEEENNENFYFDKNKLNCKKKKNIFEMDNKKINPFSLNLRLTISGKSRT